MFQKTIPIDFQQQTSQLHWIHAPQLTIYIYDHVTYDHV